MLEKDHNSQFNKRVGLQRYNMTLLFKNYLKKKKSLLNPISLGLECKYILMTTDIWMFQDSGHPFHKVT